MAERLDHETADRMLADLDGWHRDGDRIQRDLEFATFLDAIAFINRIAPHAEAADHHPEIFNVYNRVELVLTTHDADGLTEKDFALAAKLDAEV